MNKLTAILSIFLLLLAACAKVETQNLPQQPGVKAAPGTPTPGEATPEQKLMEQVKSDTLAGNVKTTPLFVPINSKKGKAGDYVVFGSVFNLLNLQAGGYFAKITFVEARDSNSNKIEVDKDTIRSWLVASQTVDFNLPDSGSQFIPVEFRVGSEIKPGVKTAPGTYQYEVQVYRKISDVFNEAVDPAKKSVFLKIE